jgi:hypothetical protein
MCSGIYVTESFMTSDYRQYQAQPMSAGNSHGVGSNLGFTTSGPSQTGPDSTQIDIDNSQEITGPFSALRVSGAGTVTSVPLQGSQYGFVSESGNLN